MTLTAMRRTRGEQIGDILTGIEHVWKMYPSKTFAEVLAGTFGDVPIERTDDETEMLVRTHLKNLMSGSRDRT